MLRNLKRLAISAFVVFHVAAITIWIVPTCALKVRACNVIGYYIMPTALWEYWGMFAPDPVHDSVTLEAVVLDHDGLLHTFQFPTEADRSRWDATLHYRHSKYACNFSVKEEFKAAREFAARHVVRQLKLPARVFPVDVQLMYRVAPTAPPGVLPDPMIPATLSVIESYRFPTLQEVLP